MTNPNDNGRRDRYHRTLGDDMDDLDSEDLMHEYQEAFSKPQHNEVSDYPDDWQIISKNYRNSVGYRCEICDVFLGSRPNLLHTHHITGNKSNCDYSNLQALCILCHALQPGHANVLNESSSEDIEYIRRLRLNKKSSC